MESDQSGIAPLASVPSTQADDPVSHPHGIEHPIDQNSIGQSIEHSIEHSIGQSIGQSIEGSIGQSIGDSIERSIANSISIDHHGAHVSPITTTQHQLEEQLRQHYGQLNQPQMQVGAFDTDSADPNHAPTLTRMSLTFCLYPFASTPHNKPRSLPRSSIPHQLFYHGTSLMVMPGSHCLVIPSY